MSTISKRCDSNFLHTNFFSFYKLIFELHDKNCIDSITRCSFLYFLAYQRWILTQMFTWNPFCHNRLNITSRKGELIFQLHIHPSRRTPPQNPSHFIPRPQLQQNLVFTQQHRTALSPERAPAVSQLPGRNTRQHRTPSEAPEDRPIPQQPPRNPQQNRRDGISEEAECQPQQAEEPPKVPRL